MPSAAELKAELRALRKEKMKPVSRMRVSDISSEIERLRGHREETPAPAATPSSKSKRMAPAVETIKAAKASEFPTAPADMTVKVSKKKPAAAAAPSGAAPKKKESKLAKLLKMMESDSECE